MKKSTTLLVVLVGTLAMVPALASDMKGAAKDAWIAGRIETVYLLNTHLNGFTIDTDVKNGVVHLSGTVESSIDRDLAGQLAKGVDGVTSVDNDLQVKANSRSSIKDAEHSFADWVDDATTTADVKTRLIADRHTHGLKIDVDTTDKAVTLSGKVASAEEKQLAGTIARNASDGRDVHNKLMVE